MKKSTKVIIGIAATIAVLIFAFTAVSYFVLKSYVPDYNSELTSNQLNNNVKIYRDENAVPYIIAEDKSDAAFALGFVHAQERMFQMDLARRAGEGRLSEVFGSETLEFDLMFKKLRIEKIVDEHLGKLSDLSKQMLSAYSDGVNFYLDKNEGTYSIEFDVIGYTPEKWKPKHSLIMAKLLAFELNLSWWSDITYAHLLQKFETEKVKEIIPDYPDNAPTIIPNNINDFADVSLNLIKTDRAYRDFMGFVGTHIGSNNWVVNAEKSVSGKPIIANDPHLAYQAPGRWYVASIKSPGWNVDGFTLPGMPAVVIGKNEDISWVLTNVMADDADFYFEELDSSQTKYFLDGEWRDLRIEQDTIIVRDSTDVIIEIKSTHRGPIVTGARTYKPLFNTDNIERATISMNWTAYQFSDELNGILLVNQASDWKEFLNGVKDFTVPGQNFVYGDNDGNIGYVCAARLPIRNNVSPTMIYDGRSSENDWRGFISFQEMPKLFNPSENFIASANNKTLRNFRYHISNIWEPPSRIERIREVLQSKDKLSITDYKQLQNDFYSHYARKITPFILNAFGNAEIEDKNLKASVDLLRKWNFIIDKRSQTPAIFNGFLMHFLKNTFMDEMGEELFNEYVFLANVPYRIIFEMLNRGYSSWFNNIGTEKIETRDDIIRNSFVDALDYLEENLSEDIADWQWGEIHKVEFEHFFSGFNDIIDSFVNIGPYKIGGDGTTVFNTEYSFVDPYSNNLGPSMRFIYDFSQPDEFHFILPTGQSGHIMSDHYSDMTDEWLDGKYVTINTGMSSIENSAYKLTLIKNSK